MFSLADCLRLATGVERKERVADIAAAHLWVDWIVAESLAVRRE